MPSPFPGMDPYLEGSEWSSVHHDLSSEIARQLAPRISPKYIVRSVRRFVIETHDAVSITTRDISPDVGVLEEEPQAAGQPTATATLQAPLRLPTVIPVQVPQVTVEIRDVAQRHLVTAIEVLSMSNKQGDGYREYLDKRGRLLHSTAHLLELDLLRSGKRIPMEAPLPGTPYFIFLSRAGQRPMLDVWPIALAMRLPVVPVPLLPGDADVLLDVQAALESVYDTLRYDLSLDYTRPPDVPLQGSDAAWAAEHLAQWRAAHGEG